MPPATILMIFMNNPKSITQCKAGGCDAQHGDPRFVALKATALELQRRGHRVLIDVAGGLSIRPDQAREQLLGFEWIDDRSVSKYGKPAIAIAWFAYFADKGTKRSPIVQKLLNDATVPRLWYENGMTKASVTVDPKGFLGDSYYVSSLNSRVQRPPFDEAKCEAHIREHLESDSSKRPQSRVVDIPASIVRRYIFIPTQKFDDLSVRQYSAISYPQLLDRAVDFCRAQNLSLVIKVHPHLRGEARSEQLRRIRRLRASYTKVYESRASINFLTASALFTVTLNGGTIMDNFYTQSPVLTLAKGFFSETDAVVSDVDVLRGMSRMLAHELPWSAERKRRQRQVVCWYDRMCLKATNTGEQNVKVVQAHVDALGLDRIIEL